MATAGHRSSPVNGSVEEDDWPAGSGAVVVVVVPADTGAVVVVLVAESVEPDEDDELGGLDGGDELDGCVVWWEGAVVPPSGSVYC